ncbi:MAG: hypothetical protein ABSG49_07730 [Methanoregula sp.]|jgi:hypothetical protein|uniref:hypothetical protein n=1 Tax=Methanoregula sp. TaxID=2052170 RepID=UPI003C1D76AA
MDKSSVVSLVLLALLVTCACIAGCSDSSSSTTTSGQTAVTTSPLSSSALYVAGDIIKNPKSGSAAAVLIIGYNPGTDMYERAYIYPNSDGSWGHRIDTSTAKVSRSIIEQVYTEKVRNMAVSAVPIGTPTTAATVAATSTIETTTETTTATTTTPGNPAPVVKDINPFIGTSGNTVSITDLEGLNFISGANVTLEKSGEPSITATDVSVSSSTKITCTFVIPSGTATGQWNVVVTNPDGQSHSYTNLFTIYKGDTTATTTTTSTTTAIASNVTIISLSPVKIVTGGLDTYINPPMDITGTNLTFGSKIILTQGSSTITSSTYSAVSNQEAHAFFTIPGASTGTWTVSVVDSSGNVLAKSTDELTISMS